MHPIYFNKIRLTTGSIKGVLIDIDDTLYAYLPAHEKALSECQAVFSKEFANCWLVGEFKKKYREKREAVTERLKPQGICRSRLFAFQALFEETAMPQAFNTALKYETLYWRVFINNMKLCAAAGKFLQTCKSKGLATCAVSDMQTHFQVQKLQALGVDHLIDYLVTSEEIGKEKPAPEIFQTALKKLNLKPNEVIMVGDNLEKDIEGAEAVGIKGFMVKAHNEN